MRTDRTDEIVLGRGTERKVHIGRYCLEDIVQHIEDLEREIEMLKQRLPSHEDGDQ